MMTPQARAVAHARTELADIETDAAQGVPHEETRRKVLTCAAGLRRAWPSDPDLDDLRTDLDLLETLRGDPDNNAITARKLHADMRRKINTMSTLRPDPRGGPLPGDEMHDLADCETGDAEDVVEGIGHDPPADTESR